MAEVLGIISAVGSILKSLSKIISIIDRIHNAPKDAKETMQEVEALRAVIQDFGATLKATNHKPKPHWIETSETILQNTKTTAEKLEETIQGSTGGVLGFGRVKWTLNSTETANYCEKLRSYTMMLNMLQGSAHWYRDPIQNLRETANERLLTPILYRESTQRVENMIKQVLAILQSNSAPPKYGEQTGNQPTL
jgi:hypothetical protein